MAEVVWGIHAGRTGDADRLFLKSNVVAVGWAKVGDLGQLPSSRDAFRSAVADAYPDRKPGSVPVNAGQLFRFVHGMKVGDLVVYPSRQDRLIHVGRVSGPYRYEPALDMGYPNCRAVQWIAAAPRTQFSQGALYGIGAAMSLFQIESYAEEFRAVAEGKPYSTPVNDDHTIDAVSEEVVESTKDFVLKKLSQELKGHPLAGFVGHLLNTMGYRTRISPEGADGGIDIVAHKDELGFEPPIVKVQVKSGDGSVGDPVVSALYGKVATGEYGLLITLGSLTNQAKSFARSKSNLRLIDGSELVDLILSHYEQFDSKYKSIIPLRQVYVPEVVDDSEE